MKKLFFAACISLLAGTSYAQTGSSSFTNGIPAPPTPSISLNPSAPDAATKLLLGNRLRQYAIYNLDYAGLSDYIRSNKYQLEFNLGEVFLSLQRHDILAPESSGTAGEAAPLNYEVTTFKGFADHDRSRVVRLSIQKDGITGYVWNTATGKVQYYIPVREFLKKIGAPNEVAQQAGPGLLVFDPAQASGLDPVPGTDVAQAAVNPPAATTAASYACTPHLLDIAVEMDQQWYNNHYTGSGNNAYQAMIDNLFLTEGIYTVNFNLAFYVHYLGAFNNSYNTSNGIVRLQQFAANWNANHMDIKRDIAILYSGCNYGSQSDAYYSGMNCSTNSLAYMTTSDGPLAELSCAHGIGRLLGATDDVPTACTTSRVNIMCVNSSTNGDYRFSTDSRNTIGAYINSHAGCLDYNYATLGAGGFAPSKILKTWSGLQWTGGWYMNDGDYRVAGNFDGDPSGDEEIFFANSNQQWIGIEDFSCDQGSDWSNLIINYGTGAFGNWVRNYGDQYLAGDFDHDGRSELLSISSPTRSVMIQELLPGATGWKLRYDNGGNGYIAGWGLSYAAYYLVGDFNGDQKDDVLCLNPNNGWAMIVTFVPGAGGLYSAQTVWSNAGNGKIGYAYVNKLQRVVKGKFYQQDRDQIVTFDNSFGQNFETTYRYDNGNWQFISSDGSGTFLGIQLPVTATTRILTGNFDFDASDEFISIDNQWTRVSDVVNGNYVQHWNNGGNARINDWPQLSDGEYLMVKPVATLPKQIFCTSRFPNFGNYYVGGLYRANYEFQSFRTAQHGTGNTEEPSAAASSSRTRIYPNPTNDMVTVDFDQNLESASVVITDIAGRTVGKHVIDHAHNTIQMNRLPAGIYLLSAVFSDNSTFNTRVVLTGK